jgi:hypothetical protein
MNTTVERRGGRVYLRPEVKRLAHDTTVRLLPRPGDVSGWPVELDLRNVEFVEPFGLIYLYLYARRLLHYGAERVDIRIPRGDVNTYLTRMNVCQQSGGGSTHSCAATAPHPAGGATVSV